MEIEEMDLNIELVDCGACGASGFLFEMKFCKCGALIHRGCEHGDKCDACDRSSLVDDFLDLFVA